MARVTISGVAGATGDAVRAALEARGTLDTAVAGTGEQSQKPFLEVTQGEWDGAVARDKGGVPRDAGRRPPG